MRTAAGFALPDASLQDWIYKDFQIAVFATIVLGAVLLGGRHTSIGIAPADNEPP